MKEVINSDKIMDEDVKKQRTWIVRIVLAVLLLAALTLCFLLLFGISPAGRYLQSIEWVRKIAELFCR